MAFQNVQGKGREGLVVLLAEDNMINQVYLAELLKLEGHEVKLAGNGLQALEVLKRERVDVVLMDIRMPEMDGLTAIKRIRERDSGIDPGLPIIAMSAESELDLQSLSRSGQMDACLSKPISQETISQVIDKVVKGRSRHAEVPEPAAAEPAADEVLELDWLMDKARGNTELLRRLFTVFIGEHQSRLAELRTCLDSKDLGRLGFLAHALKGTAATMGAPKLRRFSTELDKAAKAANEARARELMDLVDQAMREVAQAMSAYLEKMPA